MTRVRLWTSWPAPDGSVYSPGEETDVPDDEAHAIAGTGAGEILGPAVELAVAVAPERAVGRRQRRKARD